MGEGKGAVNSVVRRHRRWRFASALFDEGSWTLLVNDRPVQVETKPLALLRELLIRNGAVATRDELLDAVWPEVSVVEASLTTAMLKLRKALGDEGRDGRIIVTVPRIGYRIAVPIHRDDSSEPVSQLVQSRSAADRTPAQKGPFSRLGYAMAAASAFVLVAGGFSIARLMPALRAATMPTFTQAEERDALRELDVPSVKKMLRAGWDPNMPFDKEGNAALSTLLNVCEWDKGHDREKMLLMTRTLYDAGARLDVHNVWGDTPYSIAKSERYCGANHPVTRLFYTQCHSGPHPLGDRCEAVRRPAG